MNPADDLKKAYQTSLMINIGVIGALIIYAVIVEILKSKLAPFGGFVNFGQIAILRYIFYGIAILQIFVIRILRGTFLRASASDDPKTFIIKLSRASIATAVLCELPAVLGIVLFLMRGHSRDFYLMLGLSFFLVFLYFPRYGNWEEWIKTMTKA